MWVRLCCVKKKAAVHDKGAFMSFGPASMTWQTGRAFFKLPGLCMYAELCSAMLISTILAIYNRKPWPSHLIWCRACRGQTCGRSGDYLVQTCVVVCGSKQLIAQSHAPVSCQASSRRLRSRARALSLARWRQALFLLLMRTFAAARMPAWTKRASRHTARPC